MRALLTLFIVPGLLSACGAPEPRHKGEMTPYNALLVVEWIDDEAPQAAAPEGTPSAAESSGSEEFRPAEREDPTDAVDPAEIEAKRAATRNAIRTWLEDEGIFSRVTLADWGDMARAAEKDSSDVILALRIGDLGRWEPGSEEVVTTPATINSILWITTAVGGWWVADKHYVTRSDVEMAVRRPPSTQTEVSHELDVERDIADFRRTFRAAEPLSSGEYDFGFWDRAKPWTNPLAYVVNILVPPPLVPYQDEENVQETLAEYALQDILEEMAQKLRSGWRRAAGAPFLFRLRSPRNGIEISDDEVTIRFRYDIEDDFEHHRIEPLKEFSVTVRNTERDSEMLKYEEGDRLTEFNDRIVAGESLEVRVQGLKPGLNLVRFVGRTRRDGPDVTNTVAIWVRDAAD